MTRDTAPLDEDRPRRIGGCLVVALLSLLVFAVVIRGAARFLPAT
jgi:hypothetical protein